MPKSEATKMAVMANDIQHIKETVDRLERKLEDDYVQKSEFEPIQKLVYAVVGLILTGVVGALLALVIIQPGG